MRMPMQDAWMTWFYHQHGNDGRPQEWGCSVNSQHALTGRKAGNMVKVIRRLCKFPYACSLS